MQKKKVGMESRQPQNRYFLRFVERFHSDLLHFVSCLVNKKARKECKESFASIPFTRR